MLTTQMIPLHPSDDRCLLNQNLISKTSKALPAVCLDGAYQFEACVCLHLVGLFRESICDVINIVSLYFIIMEGR
jgi:hypothetical protein